MGCIDVNAKAKMAPKTKMKPMDAEELVLLPVLT
jgi:hypothetical protein